jgi:hypothetical protein
MTEEEAKRRFFILQFTRLFAVIMVALGAANVAGKLLPDLSPMLGYVLLVVGAADFFIAPIILKRMWQKPPQ